MSLLPTWPITRAPAARLLARAAWRSPDGPRGGRPVPPPLSRATGFAHDAAAGLVVERLDAVEAAAHRHAWVELMDRALEPNVFLDPDFALPAAEHLTGARRPSFLVAWAPGSGGNRDLVALWPVVERPDPLRALASAWFHDLSTLGFPLLDRDRGAAALQAVLAWATSEMPRERGIVIRALPSDGPTARLLREVAAGAGHDLAVLDGWERAVLRRGSGRAGLAALSQKGAKELRRQRRRLGENGEVTLSSARQGDALRDAVEHFLALEALGWKGAAGTALLARPGRTAFARTATRLLGRRGACRVESLMLDGAPIAMALVLTAGDVDFLWKIAYREDVARLSPGVQLMLEITEAQQRESHVATMDSCAIPHHPMIDRLWRDRLHLSDIVVATRPGRRWGFRIAVAAERAARRLRAALKRIVMAARARRSAAGAPDA